MSWVQRKGSVIYLQTDESQVFYYDEKERPLGEGAMGTVYKGYNYNTGESVAIKRVLDQYSEIPGIRFRAKQEASLMFSHYNLVEMLGYCECHPNKGPIFIISKYVKGDTIDVFVNSRLRSMENAYKRICEMFLPVCDALSYIHSKGIIHADIKPSNIMVEDGKNVRLMDLGIAQVQMHSGSTMTTGMMGTPRYAAPEQFSASPSDPNALTAETDIYELGVTIYEVLAKKNPYDGANLEEIKENHKKIVLPYILGVPNGIVNVLRKATNPTPTARYSNVSQFKMALTQSLLVPEKKSVVPWVILSILIVAIVLLLLVIVLK